MQSSAAVSDYELGVYVNGENIRTYPYSTSATTNPLRYSSLKDLYEVHGKLTLGFWTFDDFIDT
jgi:extracellular elastinolytic metalloproteinase